MTALSIGAVIALLQTEFPDVTVSKIRYLETEGLVTPARTSTGYRRYSDNDVKTLVFILRSQRDRYLPLKVIREELAHGVPPVDTTPYPKQDALPITDSDDAEVPAEGLTQAKLRKAARCDQKLLDELTTHGLIGDEPYGSNDVDVAKAAAKLAQMGLEVRHLRMYRQFKEREADLIEQLFAPTLRHTDPKKLADGAKQADAILQLGDIIHHALRDRELRTLFRP